MTKSLKWRAILKIMNEIWFKSIHELFRSHINDRLAIYDTMDFLLDITINKEGIEDSTISRLANGKRNVPKNMQKVILKKKKWDLDSFICKHKGESTIADEDTKKTLIEELRKLYGKIVNIPYFNDIKNKIEDETIIGIIVRKLSLPNYSFINSRVLVCDNFCGRIDELREIELYIYKYTKVILYGIGGVGKTQLAKKFINNNKINSDSSEDEIKRKYKDFYFVKYSIDIKNTISNIEFRTNTDDDISLTVEEKFCRNIKYLLNKKEDSILVIDGMDINSYMSELNFLSFLPLHILITTRCQFEHKIFKSIKIEIMNYESLKKIFLCNYLQGQRVNEQKLEFIFNKVEYHTMIISLLGKAMKNSNISIDNMAKYLHKENIFGINNLSKVKSGYNGKELIIRGHIFSIYKLYDNIPLKEVNLLKHVSCFLNCEVCIEYLERWDKDYSVQGLNYLIEGGWIEFDNEKNKIRMHSLISESIFFGEKVSISDCKEFIDKIKKDISEPLALTVDPLVMRNILFSLYLRFDSSIKNYNNKEQKNVSRIKSEWWEFVYLCLLYFIKYADTVHAKVIMKTLYQIDDIFVGNYIQGLKVDSCLSKYYWIENNVEEKNEKYSEIINTLAKKIKLLGSINTSDENNDIVSLIDFSTDLIKEQLNFLIPNLSENVELLETYVYDSVKYLYKIQRIKKEYKLGLEICYYEGLISCCLGDYYKGFIILNKVYDKFSEMKDRYYQIKIKCLQIIFGYYILLQYGWDINSGSIIYRYEEELRKLGPSLDNAPINIKELSYIAEIFAVVIAGRGKKGTKEEIEKSKIKLFEAIRKIPKECIKNTGVESVITYESLNYGVNRTIKLINEVDK